MQCMSVAGASTKSAPARAAIMPMALPITMFTSVSVTIMNMNVHMITIMPMALPIIAILLTSSSIE